MRCLISSASALLIRFASSRDGSVALIFGLSLLPISAGVGVAIDYSRAANVKTHLQSALDAAVLAGAKDGSGNWKQVAVASWTANLPARISASTPDFSKDEAQFTYSGSVSTSMPTAMLGIVGIATVEIAARATAKIMEGDNSCVLTLDKGKPTSNVSLTLNGAPIINLSKCSIRSNTSLGCNGHDGDVTKAFASGTATGCQRPYSNAPKVPDIYAALASNISPQCAGSSWKGVEWEAGTVPPVSGDFKNPSAGYYHICGNLTVSGAGYLTGSAPSTDMLIVIENGDLILEQNAAIKTARTAIVLTGNNNFPARIEFPNGAGKKASLALAPPLDPSNPWLGVSLYLDPKLTKTVDNSWGPGADFFADGLVYLGNSNVVSNGNTGSNNSKCAKFVMNTFTTNGAVKLDMAQENCAAVGLKQWAGITVHLVK